MATTNNQTPLSALRNTQNAEAVAATSARLAKESALQAAGAASNSNSNLLRATELAAAAQAAAVDAANSLKELLAAIASSKVILTGAVTGSGDGQITTTLEPTGVVPGTYNTANEIYPFTIGLDGRIVAVGEPLAIAGSGGATNITLVGDITGSGNTSNPIEITLSPTGVVPGTYNSATSITPLTIGADGRIVEVGTPIPITTTGGLTNPVIKPAPLSIVEYTTDLVYGDSGQHNTLISIVNNTNVVNVTIQLETYFTNTDPYYANNFNPLNPGPMPIGGSSIISNDGTGGVLFVAAPGVTINSPDGLKLSIQYAKATLIKRDVNVYDLEGRISQ